MHDFGQKFADFNQVHLAVAGAGFAKRRGGIYDLCGLLTMDDC